jgi:3-phenylpropionate/trans-cinnamate dioxygenase ferredoxin subunit
MERGTLLRITPDVVYRASRRRRMIKVCPLASLGHGEARRIETDPPIAVFRTDDGEVFAVDDTCTHQDASLADGWLEGEGVECPLHGSRFSLRTGEVDALPATLPVRTHEVVIDADGMITVVLDDAESDRPAPTRAEARMPQSRAQR